MYQLTNGERISMGIKPVEDTWELIKLPRSKYDVYDSYVYLDGNCVQKLIQVSDDMYYEKTIQEQLSEDSVWLLPKTAKGKPVKFTSASLNNKSTPIGMTIYFGNHLNLYNYTTAQNFYASAYTGFYPKTLAEFDAWVKTWCAETDEKRLSEIQEFAERKRVRVKYREGDFFRFRIDRDLWGYGRILLDFGKMRKEKVPFWSIFMGVPLLISIYHIITEDKNVSIDELSKLKSFPSEMICDNHIYYGEYEIIGNRPIAPEEEDYPIHYGGSLSVRENTVNLQHGRVFRTIPYELGIECYGNMLVFNGIGYYISENQKLLQACIEAGSNQPYWERKYPIPLKKPERGYFHQYDLRDPRLAKEREAILAQMGVSENEIKFKN